MNTKHIYILAATIVGTMVVSSCSYKPYQPIAYSTLTNENSIEQVKKTTYKVDVKENDTRLINGNYHINKKGQIESTTRPLLEMASATDTVLLSNKEILVNKVANFRDLGGYKTNEGKQLVYGKFFRSGKLSELNNKKSNQLADLNISTVIDLRTDKEINKHPDNLPSDIKYMIKQAYDDSEDMFSKTKKQVFKGLITPKEADSLVSTFYGIYAVEEPGKIKDILDTLLYSDEAVLFHCSAGKDRTGMVAALLLSILNVDREIIIQDYLLSNDYREDQITSLMKLAKVGKVIYPKINYTVIENFQWIKPMYIEAMFASIEKKYGSVDAYISEVLKINDTERNRLINRYTY